MALSALGGGGCNPVGCPTSASDALSADYLETLGGDAVVAVGTVIRFVPAEASEFRGYDLDLRRSLTGDAEPGSFLRLPTAVPGIDAGDAVVVVASQGEPVGVLEPTACVPLWKMTPEELEQISVGVERASGAQSDAGMHRL
jgi:hypothetical protein